MSTEKEIKEKIKKPMAKDYIKNLESISKICKVKITLEFRPKIVSFKNPIGWKLSVMDKVFHSEDFYTVVEDAVVFIYKAHEDLFKN